MDIKNGFKDASAMIKLCPQMEQTLLSSSVENIHLPLQQLKVSLVSLISHIFLLVEQSEDAANSTNSALDTGNSTTNR